MGEPVKRRAFLAAVGTTMLAGCLGGDRNDESGGQLATSTPNRTPSETEVSTRSTSSGPPTGDDTLPLPLAPAELREQAVSGGPPKDGIPSIDDPAFESATEADERLDPGEPVFGLAAENMVKAYPQSILVWHEICNDVVDGSPVSVTYCPLTGTAMGFNRGETTFGVSGRLVNNNLIMYDRATETWWPQVLATAVPGPWNEGPEIRSLEEFRLVWTTWERWCSAHPETVVLSEDTGFARNYGSDPYGSYNPRSGYYSPKAAPLFASLSEDDRLPPKAVVIGARTPNGAAAFEKERLREAKLLDGELGGSPVVAAYEPGLDTGYVYRNQDELSFEYRDGRVVDAAGTSYPPDELPLDRILAFEAMWFAWSGFYPDTTLYV